ncbi:hypothetical protein QIH25_27715, partial [Klebsiella pneumoniae]|nr:hypothetical protein [Klebsiella pneumoniae]
TERLEFLAGHIIRWQGAGFVDVYPEPESKSPDNLLQSWRKEKITGAHLKLHRGCCSMQGV